MCRLIIPVLVRVHEKKHKSPTFMSLSSLINYVSLSLSFSLLYPGGMDSCSRHRHFDCHYSSSSVASTYSSSSLRGHHYCWHQHLHNDRHPVDATAITTDITTKINYRIFLRHTSSNSR
mmetsp:Transcript_13818/g.21364  ORF Transcript_13818/g.21364 Transcript_13818/m.21364 type:complete len:119 (-) Transcript_13818:343-699(-)